MTRGRRRRERREEAEQKFAERTSGGQVLRMLEGFVIPYRGVRFEGIVVNGRREWGVVQADGAVLVAPPYRGPVQLPPGIKCALPPLQVADPERAAALLVHLREGGAAEMLDALLARPIGES